MDRFAARNGCLKNKKNKKARLCTALKPKNTTPVSVAAYVSGNFSKYYLFDL